MTLAFIICISYKNILLLYILFWDPYMKIFYFSIKSLKQLQKIRNYWHKDPN